MFIFIYLYYYVLYLLLLICCLLGYHLTSISALIRDLFTFTGALINPRLISYFRMQSYFILNVVYGGVSI